jgi:hypothetical protein
MMDSLRYWVEEMHVDGFRFDLAPAVARNGQYEFDHRSPFLAAVAQDPVLRQVKLIAEPWDIGDNGYQVGGFPPGWSEWNGRYRDSVRDFWRGTDGAVQEFAARLCGSADIFGPSRRGPRPASTWSPCTTASRSRPGQLQRQAQRGQRRGQPRRRKPQPQLELRRRGRDRRRDVLACANARSATSSPPCSSRAACRCCWAATR